MDKPKSIQEILNEQKTESKIYDASNQKISAQERKFNPEWVENNQKANQKNRGKSWITDLKKNDPKAYAIWKKEHDNRSKELGATKEWAETSRKNALDHWKDPVKAEEHKQALRDGWNKPGARENKSKSVRAVLSEPGALNAHQERARQNGRKSLRPVVTPEGIFESARAWAKHVGRDSALFGYRANKTPKLYYKITQEEYTVLTGKKL